MHGDETGFFGGFFTGNRVRGWNIPLPCRSRVTEDVFPCEQSITPTSRPLRGLLPPPFEGAGSAWRLARIQCTGTRQDFGRVFTSTAERGSPPENVSMGNRPLGVGLTGRGVEHHPPLLLCLWLNGLR